ncbi:MAG: molecular chaperone HtpG [Verrucomicrobiota bacterium]
MSEAKPETREFQAEVKQLLDIVVHSLYTDREIFIRELVSNASDALEKLRHLQLTEKNVFDDGLESEINVSTDDQAGTITFQDFGLGMDREELVENLGTIAHSGSKTFLKALQEGGSKNENLIGQFGVGFYSVFMVAKEVKFYTHSWKPDSQGYCWTSDGSGTYEIEESEGQRRGAKIVIYLKDDHKEFAKADRVKGVLENYSAFVPFPLNLNGDKINTVGALWLKSASEITEEEYKDFYKFQAHAFDEPRFWLHFTADAPLEIHSLLFAPQQNMEQFGFGRMEPGVSLYCRKVLIDRNPEGLLPEWMRFVRGVVDSADLPLNISRESMQDSSVIRKLSKVLTRRFLKLLGEKDKKDPDAFKDFYANFSQYLKEGVVSDASHREDLSKLLRYESSLTDSSKQTGFADYVSRMGEDQKEIYYLFGSGRSGIESGPYLEAFVSRGIEVLFVTDPIDEFVMSHLAEFDGKKLVSADREDIELPDSPEEQTEALDREEGEALSKWVKEKLGDQVSDVVMSKRLTDSPAVVLNADSAMSANMRRVMKAMNQDGPELPETPVRFELNPQHTLVKKVASLRSDDENLAGLIAEQLFAGARLSAGLEDDSSKVVKGMNEVLSALLER